MDRIATVSADPTSEGAVLGLGALFGGIHGVIVAFMMPVMLTMMHPLVRSGDMPAPGVAMTGLGSKTPTGIVMAHIAFAIVAGSIYVAVAE